ncbi:hypothetical protein [Croceibacterium ferulae]|uniref:hypothetical protein n=1 Tax=Croceibacterium ferulae TaxID=1854641 RepID=UPI000F874D3C|nr:hypothetical protein [Croceibacterium ferulae]
MSAFIHSVSASQKTTGSARPFIRSAREVLSKDIEILSGTYRVHKRMLDATSNSSESARPVCFIVMHESPLVKNFSSSSSNMSLIAARYYNHLEGQLQQLSTNADPDAAIDRGAVSSAIEVLAELKNRDLAPPALSWHGGDAVVMLWALGDTTYAITVTDDEVGYTVRRNRKTLKLADSISLAQFKLEDLR